MGLFANVLSGTSLGEVGNGGRSIRTLNTPLTGRSNTNMEIGITEALSLGPWFAAHRIKSDQFCKTSLELFKRLPRGGREAVPKNAKYKLLMQRPNKQQNAFVFKQHIFTHRFFNGNMYALIAGRGRVIDEIIPLSPWRITVKQLLSGELYYEYRVETLSKPLIIPADNMFHWIGPTLDGLVGMGMIPYAANQIGVEIKKGQQVEHTLDNQGVPKGLLTIPGKLSDKDFDDLKEKLRSYEGPQNAGRNMVLDNGATYAAIALTPEQLNAGADQLMAITTASQFTGVPAILLGDTSKMTFNNMGEANRHFLEYGMDPDFMSFEMLCNDRLLSEEEKNEYFWEFDRSEFEKMDPEKTSIILNNGRNGGYLSANECRAVINKPPLPPEIGDKYLRPENMAPADAPYQPNNAANSAAEPQPAQEDEPPKEDKKASKTTNNNYIKEAFSGVFAQVFGRMATKADNNCQRLAKKFSSSDISTAIRDLMVEQVESHMIELTPAVFSFARAFGDIPVGLESQLKTFCKTVVDDFSAMYVSNAENYSVGNFRVTPTGIGEKISVDLLSIIEAYYANEI